jgi:hypothetical protein
MKTHYSVTNKIGNQRDFQVSFVDYENLTDLQKSFFIYQVGTNLHKMIFSLEDIFHDTLHENLIENEIFESTNFLVARIIPSHYMKN